MRILHVSLGLPPLRSGGLVRYCYDLMIEQVSQGNVVGIFHPEGNQLFGRSYIRKRIINQITSYGLHTRNLVPLNFGIANPYDPFCTDDSHCYREVLNDFLPDIIHVHSTQGVSPDFFVLAKKSGAKIVFTTHDYYPLCMRTNLVNSDGDPCSGPDSLRCAQCNLGRGLTYREHRAMQSTLYMHIKSNSFVKRMRHLMKKRLGSRAKIINCADVSPSDVKAYDRVRDMNSKVLEFADLVIANSDLAASWYRKFADCSSMCVLPITHSGLHASKVSTQVHKPLRIGYVGGANLIKGYKVLIAALELLPKTLDWKLYFYGTPLPENEIKTNVVCNGFYSENESERVFFSMDVLIVPSIAPETYSLSAIESLCAGTPVICSDMVGASVLLPDSAVYPHQDPSALSKIIFEFVEYGGSNVIPDSLPDFDLGSHAAELGAIYNKLRSN